MCARAHVDVKQLISRQDSGVAAVCAGSLPSVSLCVSIQGGLHKTVCLEADATLGVKPRNCVCLCVRMRVCVCTSVRTVSTRPLTPWGNTSPPVFLLTMIRGSRLHHTHSFGFAVSTIEKVKEDIWCLVRKGEVGSGWEGKKKKSAGT